MTPQPLSPSVDPAHQTGSRSSFRLRWWQIVILALGVALFVGNVAAGERGAAIALIPITAVAVILTSPRTTPKPKPEPFDGVIGFFLILIFCGGFIVPVAAVWSLFREKPAIDLPTIGSWFALGVALLAASHYGKRFLSEQRCDDLMTAGVSAVLGSGVVLLVPAIVVIVAVLFRFSNPFGLDSQTLILVWAVFLMSAAVAGARRR
jgi:hypothetical protein